VLQKTTTEIVYCVVVLMNRAKAGFLPYDRYKYSFVRDGLSPPHADVVVVNADNISCPAFCVSVDPSRFRSVDDLRNEADRYYCIPPQRVLCKKETYQEVLSVNTKDFDAFRSVAKMNDLNRSLEERVTAFNSTALERKEEKAIASAAKRKEQVQAKKQAKIKEGCVPGRPSGRAEQAQKPKRKKSRKSSSEESSDDQSSDCSSTQAKEDNVFIESD